MTRYTRGGYDGTLCPCPDCEYVPAPCDTCGEQDGSAERHGWWLCEDCHEEAQREEQGDVPDR